MNTPTYESRAPHRGSLNIPTKEQSCEKTMPYQIRSDRIISYHIISFIHSLINAFIQRAPSRPEARYEDGRDNMSYHIIPVSVTKTCLFFSLQPCSRNCFAAPDLVFSKLGFPHVFFSGGVFFHRHRYHPTLQMIMALSFFRLFVYLHMLCLKVFFHEGTDAHAAEFPSQVHSQLPPPTPRPYPCSSPSCRFCSYIVIFMIMMFSIVIMIITTIIMTTPVIIVAI